MVRDYEKIAYKYASDVVTGEQIAPAGVRIICQRHLDEIDHPERRPDLLFCPDLGAHYCAFAEQFAHLKGKWAGSKFVLLPWQVFLFVSLFSWYYETGRRRYRTAFVFVARKNGKSFMASPLTLYLASADGEAGAEVYTAATKLKQARIVFDDAKALAKASAAFCKKYECKIGFLNLKLANNCKIEPLTSKSETSDGLNIHGAVIDEVHALKNAGMLEVIDTACGARDRALIFQITTGGEIGGVGHVQHDYAWSVLRGDLKDDTFFPMLFQLDSDAEIGHEASWVKANPSLGESLSIEYLREQVEKSGASAEHRANILTKHFNRWQTASQDFASAEDIAAALDSKLTITDARGHVVLASVDYAGCFDCASAAFTWYDADGNLCTIQRHWIPSETITKQKSVPWAAWENGGSLQVVPGALVDPMELITWLTKTRDDHGLKVVELPYDKYNFSTPAVELERRGFDCVAFGQRRIFFSEPTKTFSRLLGQRKFKYNDLALKDMLANVLLSADKQGNVMPQKADRHRKIDGVICVVMAEARFAEKHREDERKLLSNAQIKRSIERTLARG